MAELLKHRSWVHTQNEEQKRARERMALFPANAELFFVARDIWVVSNHSSVLSPMFFFDKIPLDQPVVRLERKLCVLPGIPNLFQKMLGGLKAFLPLPPPSERPFRHQIFTPSVLSACAFWRVFLLTIASQSSGIHNCAVPRGTAGTREGGGCPCGLVPVLHEGRVCFANWAERGAR